MFARLCETGEREGGRGDNGEGVAELMVGGSMSPEWEAVAMIKE